MQVFRCKEFNVCELLRSRHIMLLKSLKMKWFHIISDRALKWPSMLDNDVAMATNKRYILFKVSPFVTWVIINFTTLLFKLIVFPIYLGVSGILNMYCGR